METIPQLVLDNARQLCDEPAFLRRDKDGWQTTTWGEYGDAVRRAGRALISVGVAPGERVAILSYNNPEWVVMHVAAMAVGAVPVGIYYASAEAQIAEILDRTGARVLLAQTAGHIKKVDPRRHGKLDVIVGVDVAPEETVSWDDFLESGRDDLSGEFDRRLNTLEPEDPATLIFTAAGRGSAIGVVLTHDNLVFASWSSIEVSGASIVDSVLSYLPLSHIAEQIFTILAPARVGYRVAFAQSLGRIRVDLPEIRPSIFFGVPLVWNGFAGAARRQIESLTGAKRVLADWSMSAVRQGIARDDSGRRVGPLLRLAIKLAEQLFTQRALAAMGLDNIMVAYSGAATADLDVLDLFAGLGVPIRQVWGLSEASGPSAVTRRGAERHGTVGLPMPGVEISIADDGEILIRGRSVFAHYLDDPEATASALREGWLHTGDLGEFGPDGLLTVTGRKKDIVITSGGKNVCPQALEKPLEEMPRITDAVVVGDGRDQLGVLISVDGDGDAAELLAVAEQAVGAVNKGFARAEQIRKVGLLPRPLSVEQGERCEDGRLRRPVVIEHFNRQIEDLYR